MKMRCFISKPHTLVHPSAGQPYDIRSLQWLMMLMNRSRSASLRSYVLCVVTASDQNGGRTSEYSGAQYFIRVCLGKPVLGATISTQSYWHNISLSLTEVSTIAAVLTLREPDRTLDLDLLFDLPIDSIDNLDNFDNFATHRQTASL